MAGNVNKMPYGSAVVSFGDYVTAAGAGSLTDVGYTFGPVELTPQFEWYDIETEQTFAPVKSIPTKANYTIKVPCSENDLTKLRKLLHQASANLTGTEPNFTLAVDAPVEQYHQVQIVTKGIAGQTTGTYSTRTITCWRCTVETIDAIGFNKNQEQRVTVTWKVMQDTSITAGGSGQYFKIVDSGGA